VLGPAVWGSRDLCWLFEPVGLFPPVGDSVLWEFEYEVGFGLLNERPRATDIDFLASGSAGVIAVEAKYMEQGLGGCSCPGRRTANACSASSTGLTGRWRAKSLGSPTLTVEGRAPSDSRIRPYATLRLRSSSSGCETSPRSGFFTIAATHTSLERAHGRDGPKSSTRFSARGVDHASSVAARATVHFLEMN
jgi:hypothetical protein